MAERRVRLLGQSNIEHVLGAVKKTPTGLRSTNRYDRQTPSGTALC